MKTAEYHGVTVDLDRDNLFDILGIQRLKESYMKDEEVSPQERFAYVSSMFGSDKAHAQRLYDYSSKHWLSYSTPILSYGRSKRGMPISCFLNFIDDTAEGLVENLSETNWLSMLGGGVGIGFGIRSSDDKSTGVMPHLKTYDASCLAYRQGRTRRGSYATYLDISHPDIMMFLEMRKGTGDPNMRCANLHHGVNITDAFMSIIERCMVDPDADDGFAIGVATASTTEPVERFAAPPSRWSSAARGIDDVPIRSIDLSLSPSLLIPARASNASTSSPLLEDIGAGAGAWWRDSYGTQQREQSNFVVGDLAPPWI